MRYNHDNLSIIPSDELAYMVRGRLIEIKSWIFRPFLFYAIHHRPSDPYHLLIQQYVEKSVETAILNVGGILAAPRHRHHGTWYSMRNASASAFILVAAAKSGWIKIEDGWEE